jgi:fumarylpyruvate hydrolase
MSQYVFPPEPIPAVPVRGGGSYAVSRIFCVGRNYAAHAREMGSDPDREPPFYFTKAANALIMSGASIPYPPGTKNYHYEMELVIAIGKPVFQVPVDKAIDAVWGYTSGLDMTRRDLQIAAREIGRPWDLGKAFEDSAVISELIPASEIGHPSKGLIQLSVNGTRKQTGDLADLIWSVPEVVSHLSQYYHLVPGDLIYTGTPEGVGPVVAGDKIEGSIDGVGTISCTIVAGK